MSYRIACHTLFDITQTGILNRVNPSNDNLQDWITRRNTQCNFDTILQVISLRSQPEVTNVPVLITDDISDCFGFLYSKDDIKVWKFVFEVQHPAVFENGIVPFGALYRDCEGVPMITDHSLCPKFLNTQPELKNIHFEVI